MLTIIFSDLLQYLTADFLVTLRMGKYQDWTTIMETLSSIPVMMASNSRVSRVNLVWEMDLGPELDLPVRKLSVR